MSNNYTFGSKGLGLKNTFKLDGILYVVDGIIALVIGAYLLYFFSEKAFEFNLKYTATKAVAIVKIIGGGYLIFLSLYLLSIGIRKIFCDFENADVPADLTKFDTYLPKQLIEILQKGKVPFKKNVGILEEFINSILKILNTFHCQFALFLKISLMDYFKYYFYYSCIVLQLFPVVHFIQS